MTDAEFQRFAATASGELDEKQRALTGQYGLGLPGRWRLDQAKAALQFFDQDNRPMAEADVIPIGSYSPKSNTWKWAWSNDSFLESLREKAKAIRELHRITGVASFADENAFAVQNESMAWKLAAMSVKHLGAMGCYRAPSSSGGADSFLAIIAIRRSGR